MFSSLSFLTAFDWNLGLWNTSFRWYCFLCSFQGALKFPLFRVDRAEPSKRYSEESFFQSDDLLHFAVRIFLFIPFELLSSSRSQALSGIDLRSTNLGSRLSPCLPRKEVIQPHLPIRLPCYDFTPVIDLTFDSCSLAVGSLASGALNSHGVTGGVYKARERIHRGILIRDY